MHECAATALKQNPNPGQDLGGGLYNIRLSIKSKRKGKSGGGRVVSYVIDKEEIIHLLTIYDKSELDTISTLTLRELAKELLR